MEVKVKDSRASGGVMEGVWDEGYTKDLRNEGS